jgi:hypothetical protein
MATRIRLLLLATVTFFCVTSFAADDYPLEKCGTREEAVDFVTKCLLHGGTSSECSGGKMSCCKKWADGSQVCVRHPEHLPEKIRQKTPPANQQPGQVTPKP